MPVYSIEIEIAATLYVRANSVAEAKTAAAKLKWQSPAVPKFDGGTVEFCEKRYSDPDLPKVSLSPAMTIQGMYDGSEIEKVHP